MKDIPKMYQNRIRKSFHNNKTVFTSYDENMEIKKYDNGDIRKKINDILNSNTFIYSKLVHIVLEKGVIKRKIIGIYGNNLLTIDNEYIPIDNIYDIYL